MREMYRIRVSLHPATRRYRKRCRNNEAARYNAALISSSLGRLCKTVARRVCCSFPGLLFLLCCLALWAVNNLGFTIVRLQSITSAPAFSSRRTGVITATDHTVEHAEDQLVEVVEQIHNLPLRYRLENPPKLAGDSANKCAKYPSLFDLSFNNIHWQVLHTSNGTFYLYSAFFDIRSVPQQKPSVRILSMANRITPTVSTYCQLWYEGKSAPLVINVSDYRYIWIKSYGNYKNGILQPYLLECVVPPEHNTQVPQSVSLVENRCDKPTNNLRINNNMPAGGQKKNFAVCVKGMSGSRDSSVRMAEWLELLFLLGADKVFLYDMGVHPNVSKLLKFYQSQGKVDVKSLTLPGEQPNGRGFLQLYLKSKVTHKRQNEVIPFNDSLYRNMNLYKFIVILDTDEVIIPKTDNNWESLMEAVAPEVMTGKGHPKSSYVARHVYFLDSMQEKHGWASDVPNYMHMLQHVHRAANYTKPGYYVKCFHDTQRVLTLHNHYAISCLEKRCSAMNLPLNRAHLQHYRSWCVAELGKVCPYFLKHTVMDNTILRYKEPLVRGTLGTLRKLGFIAD